MEPSHLISRRCRLVGLHTFDIGEIGPLDQVREALIKREPRLPIEFLVRNPHFFDRESSKPILMSENNGHSQVRVVLPDPSKMPNKHRSAVQDVCGLLEGAGFREVVFVSSSGVGCLLYILDVEAELDTTGLILATNSITKYCARLTLSNGIEFCPSERVDEWLSRLAPMVQHERTDYRRVYSLIHILDLHPGCRERASKGTSIYDAWENEWHALSVRTIEDWHDRYPEGLHYDEPNQAVSPAAVLKINMRNTVIYEYPYSKTEVEDCYYPVMLEARMWDMLVTSQLQSIQRTIARYEDSHFADVSGAVFHRLKQSALKTFNEFDGYYLSTSKRTRNLYDAAYEAFQTKQLLFALEKKIDQLDVLLSDIHDATEQATQRLLAARQRDLLEQAQDGADEERASKSLLGFIGVVTGLSLAVSVADSLKLSTWWALLLLVVLAMTFALVHLTSRPDKRRSLAARFENRIVLKATAATVLDALSTQYAQRLVEAVQLGPERVAFVFSLLPPNESVRVRAELLGRVADSSDASNGILRMEATAQWRTGHQKPDLMALLKDAAIELGDMSNDSLTLLEPAE